MVLTFVEHDHGTLAPASAEAAALAGQLARQLGESVEAVAFGDVDGLCEQLGRAGVARLHQVADDQYSPETWGDTLRQLWEAVAASAVVAPASDRGNEVMAQAAARARLPLAANCRDVEAVADAPWPLTRVRAGGLLWEDAELEADVKLLTAATGVFAPADSGAGPAEVVEFTAKHDADMPRSRLVEQVDREEGVSLATAAVVVSGGRGVGSAEGFAPLEELAALLGGAVGCSRVVTNNGWRPHSDQVGQTGTKVNPRLYIACGISGATQHWVGCMGAKTILAVNVDAEAPMVTRAAYAVIGDAGEVVSAIVEEVNKRSYAA